MIRHLYLPGFILCYVCWIILFTNLQFNFLTQARQSLIVRGLFPMLADPRHPVSHCFTTLSVLFMGLFFLGKELSVEFRSSHKEARIQGVLFWVLFICLYTLLYDTTTPSLNDWRLNQTLISYSSCRPSQQVQQMSLFLRLPLIMEKHQEL